MKFDIRIFRPFVMYCVNGKPRSSLLIESTDSMIIVVDYKSLRKMASYDESFGKSVADNDTTESPAEDSSI